MYGPKTQCVVFFLTVLSVSYSVAAVSPEILKLCSLLVKVHEVHALTYLRPLLCVQDAVVIIINKCVEPLLLNNLTMSGYTGERAGHRS